VTSTNALRILSTHGVPYRIYTYVYDEAQSGAVDAARQIGVSLERVFKTLVTTGGPDLYRVFCIPADATLDRKKAAAAAGCRRVELVPVRDLFPLTGYVRGGCSPIGMKRAFPVLIDEIATVYDWILVNAGARGLQAGVDPQRLAQVTAARFADLV
jgi:Cys-tRNA(Pro)/Cys-tRNA(Cys) deacylase